MLRTVSALTALATLLTACATYQAETRDTRTPKWSTAIVTGGSVRGGGD